MKKQIQQLLEDVLEDMGLEESVIPQVTVPENPEHGDYSTNIAMLLTKQLKRSPVKIAEQLKDAIQKYQTASGAGIIDRVEVAGPGFINLYLSEVSLISQVGEVLKKRNAYGYATKTIKTEGTGDRVQGTETKKRGQKKGKNMASQGEKRTAPPITLSPQNIPRKSAAQPSLARQNKKSKVGESSELIPESSKKRIMIEFADPNPFKEIHIGHVRNIALGESFCRLMESQGCEVRRANYEGDVGLHVARSLWGLESLAKDGVDIRGLGLDAHGKAALLGRAYAAGSKAFEDPSVDGKAAAGDMIALNKKIYAMDESILAVWRRGREWSLDYFDIVYRRLGTHFDRYYFESEVAPVGLSLVEKHIADGIFEQSEGAIVYRGEKVGLHTRVFVTKDHYATYEAKDLALAPLKYAEWPYDLSIIMTGSEQSEYFKVMLAALAEINPELSAKTRHIPFGMVRLTTGKMSSRTGSVITADWLIEEAKKSIYKILDKTVSSSPISPQAPLAPRYSSSEKDDIAEKAAIAAIKYSMLRVNAISDIAFDLEASVSFEGDSGPYLQYTYARCRSVLRKAKDTSIKGVSVSKVSKEITFDTFDTLDTVDTSLNSEERTLARSLIQFPDVVAESAENFAPNTICTYLFHLAQQFNLFYAHNSILSDTRYVRSDMKNQKVEPSVSRLTSHISPFRLSLTAATAQVLKNGLYLLGIETLEQM